ncbi:hypothetical protein B0H13DRAFT_449161 [Mycena leptocephala]|nr:hypothetical protein B0H13DRAFT_449161 [Mycena leptocephala]
MAESSAESSSEETQQERRLRLRREAQRDRRTNLDNSDRDLKRKHNTVARQLSRSLLPDHRVTEIRRINTATRAGGRAMLDDPQRAVIRETDRNAHQIRYTGRSANVENTKWWERVAVLNTSQTAPFLGLRWNRVCKTCGIKALSGERIHDQCFVCGPKGTHYQPPLPPYPQEWDYFINNRKTAGISRKLNNIFSLTAIGVYDGDFMKFSDGVAAVTLAGGRTYHRMLPAHEGQHAIRWFIHDPWAIFAKGAEMDIPDSWISSTLAGLERINPFIAELEKLNVYDDTDNIALHIEHSDSTNNEIAAIISLAPASPPSRRKLVIQRKGSADPVFWIYSPRWWNLCITCYSCHMAHWDGHQTV